MIYQTYARTIETRVRTKQGMKKTSIKEQMIVLYKGTLLYQDKQIDCIVYTEFKLCQNTWVMPADQFLKLYTPEDYSTAKQ